MLSSAIRVAREYERGVIFRLGRLKSPPKGPGLFLLIPIIDKMVRVDLRTVTLNVPPQEVITKDNVPVRVNAVAYFRIIDPEKAIVQVENFMVATSQIAQTTLRSVLGQHQLDELLSERDKINSILQRIIDEATSPWGIKVSIVEVKDVEIPGGMQRAMARQAEAERERRAKVIAAEGEFQASERLKDAAMVMAENPMSLQLRFLQTMLEISSERSSTIILPLPIELFRPSHRDQRRLRAQELTPPELRRDPLSGRTVVVAPARAKRPGAQRATSSRRRPERSTGVPSARAAKGARRRRPLRSPLPGRCPTRPGGRCGSSRTSIPAFEHQEVVVHSPRHVRSFAELEDGELAAVAAAWSRRRSAARERRVRLSPPLRQRGQRGGREPSAHPLAARVASGPTPEVAAELPRLQVGACALCDLLQDDSLEIAVGGDLALRAAAGRPRALRAADRSTEPRRRPGRGRAWPRRRTLARRDPRLREVRKARSP